MAQLDFSGRTAIVTGAGRGIGRCHAHMLAARGANVVVNDIVNGDGESPATAVVREIEDAGGTAVADTHSVVGGGENIVEAALDTFGSVDILINNAGVTHFGALADSPPEEWYGVFDIHFRGTVDLCRAAWPHLVKAGAGRIVNTASSAMLGSAALTSYGSAKGAIFSLTRSLALEGERHGLFSNVILPTAQTRMAAGIEDAEMATALKQYFRPEHVSSLVVWLVHHSTRVNNEAFQVSAGRAGRVMMSAMPTVRPDETSPENWVQHAAQLMADGPLTPLRNQAELLGSELASAIP